jgi:putative membrane protein
VRNITSDANGRPDGGRDAQSPDMKASLGIFARGLCMGAADVVPGVSGGTMALILGIYQRLLEAIRAFDVRLLRLLAARRLRDAAEHVDILFLIPLGIGILGAILFFTRVVSLPQLLKSHPEQIYALFFGLIIGSIVVLLRGLDPLRWRDLGGLAAGTLVGFFVVSAVPFETPVDSWFIFLSGALAICAMILPGISGSFILLLLRKYEHVLNAVGHFDFAVIVPFALGAATGLMLFSRLLVWLLKRHHRISLAAIVGMLVASLWVLWPFQARSYEVIRGKEQLVYSTPIWPAEAGGAEALAAFLCAAGIAAVLSLDALARRKQAGSHGLL